MRSRSRMAAWALLTSAIVAAEATTTNAAGPPVENSITVELQIDGLGPNGAKVEIKPGHPGCSFTPVVKAIDPASVRAEHRLDPITMTARSTGADRDCSFVITIKEPGLPVKTVRRGVILRPEVAGQPSPKQSVKWVVNSPTMAARDDKGKVRR